MKKIVYLSLGSNLGDRVGYLREAIERLQELGTLIAESSLYETEPMEIKQQPEFLNCAISLETEFMPRQLLSRILAIELAMGRKRTQAKGPRTIDIDIIFVGNSVIDSQSLTIPHPAMHQRRFVLEPLAEIAPDFRHPVFKRTVRELLQALPAEAGAVRRYNY